MVPARRINAVPAPEELPQRLRHCVDQTVAAEALEGWRPTADQIAALAALVSDDLTFDEYFATHRNRYPSKPTEEPDRRTSRRDPYLLPGTSLLRNNFGVNDHEILAELEFVATAGRMVSWHRRLAHGDIRAHDLDVRRIHRHLFADVYAWAGSYRVTELRLGDEKFARRAAVHRKMNRVEATARALVAQVGDDDALARRLAWLYAEYNYVHPFREGNGRTGTVVLHIVTALCGRRLDLSTISRGQWYAASRESMPARRGATVDPRPFVPLMVRALG